MSLSFLKHKKIDQVIWLGAGDLAKADLIFNAKTTVHLVDADEAIIERLHKRFKQDKNVTIHSLLISDNNNNADFSHYSLNEFNGIAQPAALKLRYPGLKQLKSDNKPATAISRFMTNVDLVAQKNNAIILDLPGLSARLLQTLINNKTIHSFNELVVLTSQEPLFEGDFLASDLIDLLEQNGFLCQMHKSSYQDYVIVQAELNPLYKKLIETKDQLTNAQNEIKNNQNLLINAQKDKEELSAQLEQTKTDLKEQLQESQTNKKQLTDTAAQLKQLQAQIDKDQAEANTQKEQQQNEIKVLNQQNTELVKQLDQKQAGYETQLEQLKADLTKQLQDSQQQYAKSQQELADLNVQLQEVHKKNTELTKQLDDEQVEHQKTKGFFTSRKEQAEDAIKQIHDLQQQHQLINAQLAEANSQIELFKAEKEQMINRSAEQQAQLDTVNQHNIELTKQLEQLNTNFTLLTETATEYRAQIDRVEKLITENNIQDKKHLDTVESHLKTSLSKGFANAINQIEAFESLQNYLIHDLQPLNFHGWPISPDIALFLIQKIEQNNYDLIIEFGSGTSTALMANIIKNKANASGNPPATKLVTFEHNQKYYQQTKQGLELNSVLDLVDFVYAPLKEYQYKQEHFLYYSCQEKLAELKSQITKSSQILVLVDGPPGATGPLARFPALPHLMEHFAKQEIHLVLDDYHRDEEKAVAAKWEELLNERSITNQSESIPSEKGLYFCQIN